MADEGGLRQRCVKFAGAPQITGTSEDCISNKREKMSEAFEFVKFKQLQFCELLCTKKQSGVCDTHFMRSQCTFSLIFPRLYPGKRADFTILK